MDKLSRKSILRYVKSVKKEKHIHKEKYKKMLLLFKERSEEYSKLDILYKDLLNDYNILYEKNIKNNKIIHNFKNTNTRCISNYQYMTFLHLWGITLYLYIQLLCSCNVLSSTTVNIIQGSMLLTLIVSVFITKFIICML
jgi:hypothetical protein